MDSFIRKTVPIYMVEKLRAYPAHGSAEVVMYECLSEKERIVGASKENIVVRMNQVHVITQVFRLLLIVHRQRYLHTNSRKHISVL